MRYYNAVIPHTRHFIVSLGVLSVVAIFALSFGVSSHTHTRAGTLQLPAAVIESADTPPHVVVESRGERHEAGQRLRDTLSRYNGELSAAHEDVTIADPTPALPGETEDIPSRPRILACDEPGSAQPSYPSWGQVTSYTSEGVRVVRGESVMTGGMPLFQLELPLDPLVRDTPGCLPSGMIGVLLDGTILTRDTPVLGEFEGRAGYALDGFPLYGSSEDGRDVRNDDLDACHGHIHDIVDEGVVRSLYHYHITPESPYSLGCFRGTPVVMHERMSP